MKRRDLMLASTRTQLGTNPPPTREAIILRSNDLLRWLFYKETGQDCTSNYSEVLKKALENSYLTRLWVDDLKVLEERVDKQYLSTERAAVLDRLKQVHKWAEEFKAKRKTVR